MSMRTSRGRAAKTHTTRDLQLRQLVSRLTTLWQAVGDDEGLDVEVIDV